MASVRRCWKLRPRPAEPVPASSKTDLSLAKADSVSNVGSASVMTNFRRGKKHSLGREVRMCEQNSYGDIKLVKKQEKEMLQAPEQRWCLCSPW